MGFEVRAVLAGFYGTRRRVGDKFTVEKEQDFSPLWMERVEKPESPKKAAPKKKVSRKK